METHKNTDQESIAKPVNPIVKILGALTPESVDQIKSLWNSDHSSDELRTELRQILTATFNDKGKQDTMIDDITTFDVEDVVDRMLNSRKVEGDEQKIVAPIKLDFLLKNPVTGDTLPSEYVVPTPVFQGKRIKMRHGFVKTTELHLWSKNERLQLYLDRFQEEHDRTPTEEEVYEMMMTPAQLGEDTEFDIYALAGSIAKDGVRRPPILDKHGTLKDGNRRVTASTLILKTGEPKYSHDAIKRVEYIYVWQLEEDDDVNSVLVALNFVEEYKKPWPEYVKARKVFTDYQGRTLIPPTKERELAIRRDLATEYGMKLVDVGRYLNMMTWAEDFEEYFVNTKKANVHDVRQRANQYIYYFEEMAKGTKPGSVAYELKQQDGLKHLVFDLLYDGKFQNWKQVREIKYINDDPTARKALQNAREEPDQELAQQNFDDAMAIAYAKRAAERQQLGTEVKIQSLLQWLDGLGRDDLMRMSLDNLENMQDIATDLTERVKRAITRKQTCQEAPIKVDEE